MAARNVKFLILITIFLLVFVYFAKLEFKLAPLNREEKDHIGEDVSKLSGSGTVDKNIPRIYKTNSSKASCQSVKSKTSPSMSVCVYDHSEFVSDYWRKHRNYEPNVEQQIHQILSKHPKMGFVDIGANIGSHAMYAGAMNRRVVAVEPFPQHIEKVAQSVLLNGFQDKYTLINNAISDKYSTYELEFFKAGNMGAFRIKEVPQNAAAENQKKTTFQSILMDDLVEFVKDESVLLKMDLEGYEDKALEHSEKFFKSVNVPYVIIEWTFPLVVYKNDTARVNHFLDLIKRRGYQPVQMMTFKPLAWGNWKKWPNDIVLRKNV